MNRSVSGTVVRVEDWGAVRGCRHPYFSPGLKPFYSSHRQTPKWLRSGSAALTQPDSIRQRAENAAASATGLAWLAVAKQGNVGINYLFNWEGQGAIPDGRYLTS